MSDATPRSPRIITPMEQDYQAQEMPLRRLPQAPVRAVHVMQPKAPVQTPTTPVMEGLLANFYQ